MFIEVPVLGKKGGKENYLININNINYLRRWVGDKGMLQTVVYFNSTEKYIIVDRERDDLANDILLKSTKPFSLGS
jgi:hypothetical protein